MLRLFTVFFALGFAAGLFFAAGLVLALLGPRRRRQDKVRLQISSISFEPKPKPNMTNLRSTVLQFAQLALNPVNAGGTPVKLDEDAVVAEVTSGEGAKATVQVLNDDDGGRRFLVSLIPGDAPGEYGFKVRGDAQPGEGVEIIEEEFTYTVTPANAVSLGVQVNYLAKTSLPASA